MVYETYRYIFIGGAILAGVMLVVTILLFFLLHIPTIIGSLSGRKEKKAIKQIRGQNATSKNIDKGSDKQIVDRTRKAKKGTDSVRTTKPPVTGSTMASGTLSSVMTSDRSASADASQESATTTVLAKKSADGSVEILLDITYIHTSEVIE